MVRTALVTQRRERDCGIAALATILGVSYDDANDAVIATLGKRLGAGVFATTLVRAAAFLKRKLVNKRRFDPDEARGILGLECEAKGGHFVVLLGDGVVFDPEDGVLMDLDDYVQLHGFKLCALLAPAP